MENSEITYPHREIGGDFIVLQSLIGIDIINKEVSILWDIGEWGNYSMSQEYIFEFHGTKQDLLLKLNISPNYTSSNDRRYYFNDYIIELSNDEIHFGIQRAGHSGGYWFVPKTTIKENIIEFRGTIEYIPPDSNSDSIEKSVFKRSFEKIGEFLFYILVTVPIIVLFLIMKVFELFKWIISKILRRPIVKEKTTEEKLFCLMETHLGCIRK